MALKEGKLIYNVAETADYLSLSQWQVRHLVDSKALNPLSGFGRRIMISVYEIERFLKEETLF